MPEGKTPEVSQVGGIGPPGRASFGGADEFGCLFDQRAELGRLGCVDPVDHEEFVHCEFS